MKSSLINRTTAIATGALIALTPVMAFAEQPAEVAVPTLINYVPNQSLTKEIVQNGVPTDVQVYSVGGTQYIGVRDFADLHGYVTQYNKDDNTVSVTGNKPGSVYVTKIGSDTVYCNGKAYTISPAPIVVDQRLLMPLDQLLQFTGDTSMENADTISLYTKSGVAVDGASIGSTVATTTFENNYDNGAKDTETCTIQLPKLSGMKDVAFQDSLNKTFEAYAASAQEEAKTTFEELPKDDTFNYNGEVYVSYNVNNYKNGILSITVNKYVFANGANGQTYATTYNIDLNNSKVLTFDDVFSVDNYEEVLVNTINNMIDSDPATYEGVEKVTKLDDNNFYLQDGNIVIYYMPYEISYGARGTVTFSIDTNSLSDYMVSDYVGL